jgi:hypothetical protein
METEVLVISLIAIGIVAAIALRESRSRRH